MRCTHFPADSVQFTSFQGLSDETFNRSADDLEQSEDVLSPDVDDEGKPKVKKKRRRKKKVQGAEHNAVLSDFLFQQLHVEQRTEHRREMRQDK